MKVFVVRCVRVVRVFVVAGLRTRFLGRKRVDLSVTVRIEPDKRMIAQKFVKSAGR